VVAVSFLDQHAEDAGFEHRERPHHARPGVVAALA